MAKQIDWLKGENRSSIIDVTPQYETPGEDSFNNSLEKSQLENGILKRELRELKQSREEMNEEIEKLKIKVERKKNELKIEKSNTNTFRLFIEELNRKIEELKNAKVPDKTIQGKTNIQSPILNEEMIEKIVLEKTGLESQVREQIEEIKSLNSQINLTKEQFEIILIEKSTQQKETEERLQQELGKLKSEEIFQNKEQEKQIIDLKTSLEQSGREIIKKGRHIQEIEGVKLKIETELNRVRRELKEKTESSETHKSKIEQLTKANSELEMSVQISNEKNKKYKQEHFNVTQELQDANTKYLEMQQNLERTILEAEMNSTTEIKELNESEQKQETESKALKDQVQLLTKQNQENRKTCGQLQNELARRDEELTKLRKQTEENEENKQAREELEVKLKGLNDELEQQKSDYEDLNFELQKTREELEWKKNEFEVITKDKGNMQDKYYNMEIEKQDLQEQIDGFHTLMNSLKQKTGEMKFKLDEVEKQLTNERIQKAEKPKRAEGFNPITPIPNPTLKSPIKIKYRSANIFVVKLKAFPDPTKHARKQIVCTIKRSYELGTLVDIFDVQVKVGKKTQISKYVGIYLDEPFGDCNGAIQGVQHFKCEPNHGYFLPIEDVYVPVV